MNTTSLLLGMIATLLFVAFFLSFGGHDDSERKKLRKEIALLEQESETLRLQAALKRQSTVPVIAPYQSPAVGVSVPTTPDSEITKPITENLSEEMEEIRKQLAEQKEANAALEEENQKATRKQRVAEEEASMAWTERTKAQQKQERERKRIEIAMKMGTVTSVNKEYGFVVFTPAKSQQFSRGQTLGIRRNSGVLGQIIIDSQQGGSYVANIKPNAYAGGIPPVQEGDEIIILPASYRAPGEEDDTGAGGSGSTSGSRELRELLPE